MNGHSEGSVLGTKPGYTLCVLGCGTMGVAVLSGVLASIAPHHSSPFKKWELPTSGTSTPQGEYDSTRPNRFLACVRREESAKKLLVDFSQIPLGSEVKVSAGKNVEAAREADVVLLSCKPYNAADVLTEEGMFEALEGKLLISQLAGTTISQLKSWVPPTTRVIRAMPNTPCKIREGMTIVSSIPSGPDFHRDERILLNIFSSIGRCRFLDEKHFDACTALAGSGPAFACIVLEAMADGGVMMGLPRAEALEMACQTLQGTARMALKPNTHPAQIRDAVTTPGGCTIAGLLALEDGRIRSTIARAIQVATERASDLGQPVKK
ncbi:pyrroline-5-carboxylate reductase [Sistotremastrum niveocremeum HHB9708]|uniref:Pyrroline-5-carboxylate reductase n=2 Tax=Sistotremastraceae TaxID=3402574 RepID=A0A165AM38_9AGAM|nr:pyrroline-5-carboxylate reductase [Sistotremastrum niveocremeum HHB9708]KZT42081.1 putative delta 1-pyrroline-5-carboxylate reductase [Sistotremastrum suecicum HHB10207 ss-3]